MNWESFRRGLDTNSVEELDDYIKELRGAREYVAQSIERLHRENAEIDIEMQRTAHRIKKLKEVAA